LVVAVDLGFGWTKALSGSRAFVEPSVVGPAEAMFEGLGGTPQGVRLWEQGREYFIGNLAIQQCRFPWHNLNDNKPDDPKTIRLLKAGLAAVSPVDAGQVRVDCLVTGLPVNLFFDQKEPLENRLKALQEAPVKAQIGSRQVEVQVSVGAIKVVPQPFGSLMDLILDQRGQILRRDIAKGRVLVVDIGFHTVDLLAVEGLNIISRLSKSTNFGLASAYEALAQRLNKPLWQVDQLLLRQSAPEASTILQHLAENINRTVESLNERFDTYVLTGGGGGRLAPWLLLNEANKVMLDDPQLANVRGYLKAGERVRQSAASSHVS